MQVQPTLGYLEHRVGAGRGSERTAQSASTRPEVYPRPKTKGQLEGEQRQGTSDSCCLASRQGFLVSCVLIEVCWSCMGQRLG